jgi:hypothetical protein
VLYLLFMGAGKKRSDDDGGTCESAACVASLLLLFAGGSAMAQDRVPMDTVIARTCAHAPEHEGC